MIHIKQLTEDDFEQVIQLSLIIFTPPMGASDRFHQLKIWNQYYSQNGLLLGAFVHDELAGYVFFYDRKKDKKSSHCWLAGVHPAFRGKGVLKALIEKAQMMLKQKGYEEMTINTYPEKFPAMFDYLIKYNFIQEKEEEREWQGHMIRKCFFRKPL